jgi:hypothetical protein
MYQKLPYVDSRDERSLSIYGSECQIWKTFTTMFTAIDPNKDISKTRKLYALYEYTSPCTRFTRYDNVTLSPLVLQ